MLVGSSQSEKHWLAPDNIAMIAARLRSFCGSVSGCFVTLETLTHGGALGLENSRVANYFGLLQQRIDYRV